MAEEHNQGGHDEHAGGDGHGGSHKKHGHAHGHGGGHAEGEHEGAPEWLISFADNVMLQMGFFVILLALNMGPKGGNPEGPPSDSEQTAGPPPAMLDFAIAVREAFNNPVSMNSTSAADAPLVRRMMQKAGSSAEDAPEGRDKEVSSVRPGDYFALGGAIAFAEQSAELSASAEEQLRAIAERVRGVNTILEVRGHCSGVEVGGDASRAYRLSYDRAFAVASALRARGVEWKQMRVVSIGDSNRVVQRAFTAEAQRANQRVEVVLTGDVVPRDPYSTEPGHDEK
ncbi:MAG: OmpA family protein [Phycisphaerales bacterium]|nr:OmpA family protein [Phycisphaerales bacterium]